MIPNFRHQSYRSWESLEDSIFYFIFIDINSWYIKHLSTIYSIDNVISAFSSTIIISSNILKQLSPIVGDVRVDA